ncbi:lipopolysaccharide biosynthesis protein [Clostridium taeniosporum]|uniref:Lipopolysaccharide biosynthesis protein n=1 Tax=Clostridium taeniosporum TaxID=394958 RepID=A0A1D7XN92_9CLOT|nr:lipopolysaccharide biosynthesis protein [Clostridium taeniosporum]AOR24747.1 lipopolysaccharide biosynthesis protein [Clostridium taeniosporum]
MKEENIKSKFINATKWSTITEIAAKLVSPIINMILARIISPEAFGVVATVTMIMSFADMFTDAGFQKYLVQHEFNDEDEKFKNANVAFWTNFVISIFLWAIIIVFREQIAVMVGNPGLGNVIAIACVQLLLTSFSSIQMALYRRDFDFKTLFSVRMVSVCIPFIVTIPLTFLVEGYWALIIGSIIIQLSNAVILTMKSKWKIGLFYKIDLLKEMLSFSIWSLIESISIWLSCWIDILVIGNIFNQYYLGIYKTASSMVGIVMSLIFASVVPVFFSALSRLQHDNENFNKMYFNTQRNMSILIFPLGVGIYLYSDLATSIMLGSKWNEASAIIGVCALTNAIKIILGDLCSEVYRAKGKPKISFLAQILHLVVLIPVCIISSKYGFWLFVYARSWIRMEFVLVHFIIMKFIIKFPIERVFKNVMPTAVSTFAMGILICLLKQINNNLLWSFTSIIICSLFYFGVLYLFPSMRKEMNGILEKFKVKFTKEKYVEAND